MVAFVPLAPGSAAAIVYSDNIPGVPMAQVFRDSLNPTTDDDDVFRVWLELGENIVIDSEGAPGTRFFLYFYGPATTDLSDPILINSVLPYPDQSLTWTAGTAGWYYLNVHTHPSYSGGGYTLTTVRTLPGPPLPDTPESIWGSDRYTTAVNIANKNFPGWINCDHVIIASGEDRAAADPLAASGLVFTYGAPILLVQTNTVPASVMTALKQISAANGGVTIHVVGGSATIPSTLLSQISGQVPGATFERIEPAGNRFELAASIARRMDSERPAGYLISAARQAFVANGADSEKFFDALALSALSAKTGYPILLVNQNSIPSDTTKVLADLGMTHRIVGGGPATVSDGVLGSLAHGAGNSSERWWGSDRYATARKIADNGSVGMVQPHSTAVAAKLPDALTGGAFVGLRGGPILITNGQSLSSAPRGFLQSNTGQIREAWALGGPASLTDTVKNQMQSALQP